MSSKTYPSLNLENELWSKGARFVIGMDEVGRGAIAGPVAVGVALLDRQDAKSTIPWPAKLCDSKLISEKVRNEIVGPVSEWVSASAVGMVSAADIDAKGIVKALAAAGSDALAQILENQSLRQEIIRDGAVIILDGSHNWLGAKASGIDVLVRTKADRDCVSVAAASVVAKVARDNLMIELANRVEGYGLEGHKGYASSNHIEAVRALGPSAEHRITWLTKILAVAGDEAGGREAAEAGSSAEGEHSSVSNEQLLAGE
jgi:ribonuclease HII